MTDDELSVAYYAAKGNYEAANTCNRVEMFTKFLVAERVLFVHLGSVGSEHGALQGALFTLIV